MIRALDDRLVLRLGIADLPPAKEQPVDLYALGKASHALKVTAGRRLACLWPPRNAAPDPRAASVLGPRAISEPDSAPAARRAARSQGQRSSCRPPETWRARTGDAPVARLRSVAATRLAAVALFGSHERLRPTPNPLNLSGLREREERDQAHQHHRDEPEECSDGDDVDCRHVVRL
jgi:hypothetical protein